MITSKITTQEPIKKVSRTYKPQTVKVEKRCPLCGAIIEDKSEVVCEACKFDERN